MSRPPIARLLLALPLLLAAAGCQSLLPQRSANSEPDELARLQETVRELQRQARMNEVEVERLRRQVAELSDRLEEDESKRPVTGVVSPRPGTEAAPPPRPAPRLRLEEEDLPPPASKPPLAPNLPPATPIQAPGPVAATPLPSEGQELYDRGYTLYHQGQHVDAESAFRGFLQRYPNSDLADNAQFWIGEARLRRGDLNGALSAFRETVNRFPRGNKIPDALFRSGDCLERLGDLDGARAAWRQTIERFPNSAAAALSEERLAASR